MAFIVDTEEMTEVVIDGAVMNDVFVDGELVYSKRTLNLFMEDEGGVFNNDVTVYIGTNNNGTKIFEDAPYGGFDITTTNMEIPGAHLLEFNFVAGTEYTHTVTNSSTLYYESVSSQSGSTYEVVYLAAL